MKPQTTDIKFMINVLKTSFHYVKIGGKIFLILVILFLAYDKWAEVSRSVFKKAGLRFLSDFSENVPKFFSPDTGFNLEALSPSQLRTLKECGLTGEGSSKFRANDGSLLILLKGVDGELYLVCFEHDNWARIQALKTNDEK